MDVPVSDGRNGYGGEVTSVVDWDAAAALAGRLAPPGPVADGATLARLVRDLRQAAGTAAEHVAQISGLRPADGREPAQVSAVHVVDRPRWAKANAQMFAVLAGGLPTPSRVPHAGRSATAAEVGAVLALLSGKVIGQFDPYTRLSREPNELARPSEAMEGVDERSEEHTQLGREPDEGAERAPKGPEGAGQGRLLLVAPNVLAVERALDVVPADFRLWVALHEQTHALQFAAAPWLADHLRGRIDALTRALVPDGRAAAALVRRLLTALRDFRDVGLAALLDDAQREAFDEVSAVMALVEGHADVMMDEVGPSVVPTVEAIRAQFEQRRDAGAATRGPARVLRLLLGLDLKLAQYREGAGFVRAVRDRVGTDGFNAVWTSPETLPTAAEIADPAAWVARVHTRLSREPNELARSSEAIEGVDERSEEHG